MELCRLFGKSRQGYYQQLEYQQQETFDEYVVIELVRQKRVLWKRGSGRALFISLQSDFIKHTISVGRDKFFDILGKHGLLLKRRKKRAITTDSYHRFHKYPNLIKGIIPLKTNEIWVSDITYIWIEEINDFIYLFLITDVYSRKIIGYCVSDTLRAENALKALHMALFHAHEQSLKDGIHHSDRGLQYACPAYVELLGKYGMKPSMTENSDPRDNGIAERVNRTIKEEFINEKEITFATVKEAKRQLPKFIRFYNDESPNSSIDWLTPAQAYNTTGELKRRWKNYYKKKENINTQSQTHGEFSEV